MPRSWSSCCSARLPCRRRPAPCRWGPRLRSAGRRRTGLVVAEVVTGGASASDEYVELANAGTVPVDLAGLEVAYVTSSGATVTRKAAWTASLLVEPGRRVLLANTLGIYAAMADATYSGGLAATGGSIVLRPTGGLPVDAVGWGDALNSFVEGTAAPAPAAGTSIERDRRGHQRQRRRLLGQRGARGTGAGMGAEPVVVAVAPADAHGRADALAEPHRRADACPDARADAIAHAEPLRPSRAPPQRSRRHPLPTSHAHADVPRPRRPPRPRQRRRLSPRRA